MTRLFAAPLGIHRHTTNPNRAGETLKTQCADQILSPMNAFSLLIIVDRGRFQAYEMQDGPRGPAPRPLRHIDIAEGRERLGQQLTDKAGAYPVGPGGSAGGGAGERLPLTNELEKRAVKRLSQEIVTLFQQQGSPAWALAAPSDLNAALLDTMPPDCRRRLVDNVEGDFTRLPREEMLSHFAQSQPE